MPSSGPSFAGAEVTILWIHDHDSNNHWNLLTVIEDVPVDQEWSPDLFSIDEKGAKHSVLRHSLSEDSLALYAARSRLENIDQARALFLAESGSRMVEVGDSPIPLQSLNDETKYPSSGAVTVPPVEETPLGVASQPLQRVLPMRRVTAHACAQLVLSADFEDWLGTADLNKTFERVHEWLGVDLDQARELIGSTIWSRPNPWLRAISWGPTPDGETFKLEAYSRYGIDLPAMVVTAWSDGPIGRQPLFHSHWDGSLKEHTIPTSRGKISLQVHCEEGDLLEDRQTEFVHKVNVDMKVDDGSRSIALPGPENEQQLHNVPRWKKVPSSSIGESDKAAEAIHQHERARERLALQRRGEFAYFGALDKGAPGKAEAFVRGLFQKVQNRCIVTDPYLSANEVTAFALFVGSLDAQIDLITSHAHLLGVNQEQGVSHGRLLANELNRLRLLDEAFQPNVTVLEGNNVPPLHDRFLVVDETVYHIGGSLNHLGHRAMAISRVPAPEPVLADIEYWLCGNQSETLDEWLTRRGE